MRRNNIYKKMATILGYPTDQLHLYPDPDVAKLQPSKRKSRKELLIAEAEGLKEVDETYQEQKESAELWQTIYDSKKKKLDTEETDYTPGYDNKPFTPPRRHFTDSELESVPPSVKKGYYSKGYAGPISYDVGKTARKLKLETIVYGDE